MTSLSLKKASKRSYEVARSDPVETDPFTVFPIFTANENAMIQSTRDEAETYSCHCPGWFEKVDKDATLVGAWALEEVTDPFEAVMDHWISAIDEGKRFLKRSMLESKANTLAYHLEGTGQLQMSDASHYIGRAMSPNQTLGETVFRLKEIIKEFESALKENRAVCMCKEKPCVCRS